MMHEFIVHGLTTSADNVKDDHTMEVINTVLDTEPADFVVINGDLLDRASTFRENRTDYVDRLLGPLVERGLTWGSTFLDPLENPGSFKSLPGLLLPDMICIRQSPTLPDSLLQGPETLLRLIDDIFTLVPMISFYMPFQALVTRIHLVTPVSRTGVLPSGMRRAIMGVKLFRSLVHEDASLCLTTMRICLWMLRP